MSINLEELDYANTDIGELILRRRRFPMLGDTDVFEVILNDEYLMSSLYTAGEIALANLGLDALHEDESNVIVGGLGLGYTAAAALERGSVRELVVVEALANVVDWHERELLPVSDRLTRDPRCSFHVGNFFAEAANGFASLGPARRWHAVLLDIDHSPRHVLNPANTPFYTASGLAKLRDSLHDKGVFALWSNDPPDQEFVGLLDQIFTSYDAHVIDIDNPLSNNTGRNTVYVAVR